MALPDANLSAAGIIAEKLRGVLESEPFPIPLISEAYKG